MKYDEAIRILGNVSLDYTGMNQEEIDQMDEALTLAFNALSIMIKNKSIQSIPKEVEWIKAHKDFQRLAFKDMRISILEERIEELEAQLEESSLNEIRALMRPDEEEEDD